MPRKAKELIEENVNVLKSAKKTTKNKSQNQNKAVVEKSETSKKSSKKVSAAIAERVNSSQKKSAKKITKKTTSPKKSVAVKNTSSSRKKNNSNSINMVEYYDLPYRYNQTTVKILAQTPKMLFVYWDISEKDRQSYISQYGKDFFNNTIPFLRIKNENSNYTFDVEVDDFANSWYLPINDSKCVYTIELFRKQKPETTSVIQKDLYITSSNQLEVPNDHILFEKNQKIVYFKNVKNNQISSKNVASLSFIRNIGKIYNIYDLYKEIYYNNDEDLNILSNPSSNPSSDFIINNLN